ncbi:CRISPR-associated protein Cas5d [Aequitasia blattaphilus]|uniref:pre-crRNA processing endonuclease n=1 Tax=Aequitasia blattaphilus TaxID=2949332 RepID=A0ABT1E880_9FIRM|nr:type I-C CRISPR-associated protein Cas5c [Aequitasia blattaphilus]MCP1102030.1 type I-C CRISPR-associated protein Cas5c [Aequitasia blattaphilus]MCR8614670.1 type I-C CRISPR-associated protein Cas5c [Aequitasia blattaphilus]
MKKNQITYKVSGRYALFTDPMTKIGGEKSTMVVPTAEALIGVTSSVYWKPTIKWRIDEVKILNPIRTESKGIRPIKYDGGNDLSFYTYLADVAYEVKAHFEFNEFRQDLRQDFQEDKHFQIAKRSIKRGGRRDIFLGVRECQGYVEEIIEEETSCYENTPDMEFGLVFHSFLYPDQSGKEELEALFWYPKMEKGIIKFCKQEECPVRRTIRSMNIKNFTRDQLTFVEKEVLE